MKTMISQLGNSRPQHGAAKEAQTRDQSYFSVPSVAFCATLLLWLAAASVGASAAAQQSAPIPMDQLGAVAGQQYEGDALAITATADGARLKCGFQKLERRATAQGLWLESSAEGGGEFRVVAQAVGRDQEGGRASSRGLTLLEEGRKLGLAGTLALPLTGRVSVEDKVARFIRPGLVEEYTVSMDGVRQDFIIESPPLNPRPSPLDTPPSALRVELAVTGAKVERSADGAQLVLEKSGRRIAYTRLRVTDATGRELSARMEVFTSNSESR